eukprot:CAMPEP_0170596310 /NCGR_PEP_ID=MMETSP0224-20130122/15041_1 /TAXON_ID=285029 /ORGANISM="Togula jolla, Strain CCCM 725" /LENGTH=232 /DNA_ID=CAMNT_0010920577 /DNA_START=62 /DNA_END=760 /DNA_ORIENTATION=-
MARLLAFAAAVALLGQSIFSIVRPWSTTFVPPTGRATRAQTRGRVMLQAEEKPATSSFPEAVALPLKAAGVAMSALKPVFSLEAKLQALSYDKEAIREALMAEARSAPVVVFTYSLSPFCTAATQLLESMGAKYKEVVLAPEWFLMLGEGAAKRAELGEIFGRTSMPHIFIGGRSIGGLAEGTPGLIPLYESGELEPALKKVGALPEDNPFGFFLFAGDSDPKYGQSFDQAR